MDLIKNQYIVCLQEIRQASKVLGFRSFTKTREGEKDGRVSILVKNAIKSGVKVAIKWMIFLPAKLFGQK